VEYVLKGLESGALKPVDRSARSGSTKWWTCIAIWKPTVSFGKIVVDGLSKRAGLRSRAPASNEWQCDQQDLLSRCSKGEQTK